MATRFQQLGAFIDNIDAVTDEHLDRFSAIGGRWVVPLLSQLGYPDDHDKSCVNNMALLTNFITRCADNNRHIAVGGWFNGWNGGELNWTPQEQADKVAEIVHDHNLGPVVLDLEAAYKGDSYALPMLIWEVRKRLKTREIGVSTNEPNDSIPYNGKACWHDYRGSMRRLGVKLMPQWYNAPTYGQGQWMMPHLTMQWVHDHGMEDNWNDPTYANKRAIPSSFIHGTLEVTGLEGAYLKTEIDSLIAAKQFGYTTGLSLYLLEKTPAADFDLISKYRNQLYLV